MDGQTIRAVAELICGSAEYGGELPKGDGKQPESFKVPRPYYQKWQIKELFAACGFASRDDLQEAFERSQEKKESRVQFAQHCIEQYCFLGGESDVSSPKFGDLLLHLSAPRTYPTHPELAALVIDHLNSELSFHGVRIQLNGARPKLVFENGSAVSLDTNELIGFPSGVDKLTNREVYAELASRWQEALTCSKANAFRASMILLGGVFEAILRSIAFQKSNDFKGTAVGRKERRRPSDWDFALLTQAAVELHLIDVTREKSLDGLRMLRNLVHPFSNGGQLQAVTADKHSVDVAVAAIRGFIEDAEKYFARAQ